MRLLHRLSQVFVTPPPWLTLLVGVILGGVLTSTFTFRLWWCSYGDMKFERETMRFVQFREHVRDLPNLALTDRVLPQPSQSMSSDCLCGSELKRLQDSIPAVSKSAILEPSEKPSMKLLTRPSEEDQFIPLKIHRTANETKISNFLDLSRVKELQKNLSNASNKESVQYLSYEFHMRKQVLVAVITSGNHLQRASTVYDTWGKDASQIIFFVGRDCNATSPYARGLPLVRLPDVPDLPVNSVEKTFSAIKYISDNYLDQFQWFLLANDNLYVRIDRVHSLLRQLNPSKKIFLGRAARGKEEDAHKLSLLPHEHYCLGSSGVALSYGLLQAMSYNLEFCLNAILSSFERGRQGSSNHADVELGRCVSRHVGVQCSQAAQAKTLFFEDYSNQPLTLRYLEKSPHFQDLLTYHPVPTHQDMLTVHYFYKSVDFKLSLNKAQYAQEELKTVCKTLAMQTNSGVSESVCDMSVCPCENDGNVQARCPSMGVVTEMPAGYQATTIYDFQTWHYFDDRTIYSDKGVQPSFWFHAQKNTRRELQEMLTKAVQAASDKYGRRLKFKKIINGWVRHNPSKGNEYIVDCVFIDGYRRTVPRRVNFIRPLAINYITQKDNGDPQATVVFVVPVAKVNERFRDFISMYESVGLESNERVKLVLSVYGVEDVAFVNKILEPLRDKYPEASVTVVEGKGEFSRGKALHLGMSRLYPEELAFICDVDMAVSQPFLDRCRKNTIRGRRVYYPEFFKLYNLDYVYRGKKRPSRISMKRMHGHWAYYSYGMLCIYRSDYDAVGGMNTNIVGWGDEDVHFFEKVLKKRLEVLRAPDTALSHRWHEKNCPRTLTSKQLKHCFTSRGENLADRIELANYIYEKGVQIQYSTSLSSYSPQLVAYGNETDIGEAGAEEEDGAMDSDAIYN